MEETYAHKRFQMCKYAQICNDRWRKTHRNTYKCFTCQGKCTEKSDLNWKCAQGKYILSWLRLGALPRKSLINNDVGIYWQVISLRTQDTLREKALVWVCLSAARWLKIWGRLKTLGWCTSLWQRWSGKQRVLQFHRPLCTFLNRVSLSFPHHCAHPPPYCLKRTRWKQLCSDAEQLCSM